MINPRTKGKGYEYHIRDLINAKFRARVCTCSNVVKRTPMSGAIDGWKGDQTVICRHTIWKDYSVECKKVEKINIWACLNQAVEQASKTPILIFSRNHDRDYAAMRLEDLFILLQELEDWRNGRNKPVSELR